MNKFEKLYNEDIKKLSELYNNSSKDIQNEIINHLIVKTKNIYSNNYMPNLIVKNLFSIRHLDKKENLN